MRDFKKNFLTLLLAALLVFSCSITVSALSSPPPGFPQAPEDLTGEDKILSDNALKFLSDVANINTSSYNITVRISNEIPGNLPGKTLHFNLSSSAGIISVIAEFTSGKLFWSTIYSVKGSPVLNQSPSTNALANAKSTLQRLRVFSAEDYISTFQGMLNSVNEIENSKTTDANYTQEITVNGNTMRISWEPFANGLSNQQNKLYLEFKNGNLEHYSDWIGIRKIGSSGVKISEEQAIQIAVERARAFSWIQGGEQVSNVTVLEDNASGSASLQNRGNNTLYPIWNIMLPLDKEYPGGVTAFRAAIWADTGEVLYFSPIGFYGAPVPLSEPQQTPTSAIKATSENNQQAIYTSSLVIGLTIAAVLAIVVGFLINKKRR
jgi:hypothetical protein